MRVKDLGTRPAPASIRELFSRVVRGHAPAIPVHRRQISYWQERGWTQTGSRYTGAYQTPYAAFQGSGPSARRKVAVWLVPAPTSMS